MQANVVAAACVRDCLARGPARAQSLTTHVSIHAANSFRLLQQKLQERLAES
jgi:hypothetical protein